MIQHNVIFKWSDAMPPAAKEQTVTALLSLRDQVPGIVDLSIGDQCSPEGLGKGFHTGLSVRFVDVAARDGYLVHPAHTAAVAIFKPYMDDVIVLDYEC